MVPLKSIDEFRKICEGSSSIIFAGQRSRFGSITISRYAQSGPEGEVRWRENYHFPGADKGVFQRIYHVQGALPLNCPEFGPLVQSQMWIIQGDVSLDDKKLPEGVLIPQNRWSDLRGDSFYVAMKNSLLWIPPGTIFIWSLDMLLHRTAKRLDISLERLGLIPCLSERWDLRPWDAINSWW